ncbi:MAG: precorrin-6y C5,15-methyltransferase (decarboxylating) subunit CbiE [Actinomycetales bacterium]|nr:precorrin-6y C5,15-methyltransferase (decarboxylating) subunit CbiE [Actinomycetales bacterium]
MITVHGLLGAPTLELRVAAATADWVVGGRRHLDALSVEQDRRITLGALRPAIARISDIAEDQIVLVVASGDPLYFGAVRALREAGHEPEVVTAPSSIATAFAAVALPWDDAVVVSAHGRPLAVAANLARAHPKVAVFTSADNGIRELAALLADLPRWYVLAERLGEPDQCVRVLDSARALSTEPAEPNVVLVLAEPPESCDPPWSGTIAGRETRRRPDVCAAAAVAFARLLPEPGELLAASGSLAEEVAALARWCGAAVVPGPAPDGLAPDVILTDNPLALDANRPRAVVLTTTPPERLPAGYRWTSEHVGGHHLTTGVGP